MASKNFSGILRGPLGTLANNDKYRFTHVSTTGEVIRGSTSYLNIGDDGVYNIDIEYGNVTIESYSELGKRWINQGTTTINADTVATTLPALLNALVPASDPLLLELQALLEDAENSASDAMAAAAQFTKATTVQAEAGTDDVNYMTSLKTSQAISAQTGTAATKNVTTSATDATNGRLIKVGDFGIGGAGSLDIPFAIGSTQNAGGQYRTIGTTGGEFPTGITKFGYVDIAKYDGNNLLESLAPVNSDRFFKRRVVAGEPQSWVEMYHSGNTNFNEFIFNANDVKLCYARVAGLLFFELPVNGVAAPTSATVTGTFSVIDLTTGSAIISDGVPEFLGASSSRILVMRFTGSFTPGANYLAYANAGGATIKANY